MKRTKKPASMSANEGTEEVPPGATRRAADRTRNPGLNPGRNATLTGDLVKVVLPDGKELPK